MIKLAIPLVIGLVVGLGASTGAVVLLGSEPTTVEEGLEALGEHGDSASAEASHGEEEVHAEGEDGHAAEEAAAGLVEHPEEVIAAGEHAAAVEEAPEPDAPPAMSVAELSGLFATMKAQQAASVLEHMEDGEVQTILGALGNREAAAILSNLSPERAAVISRAILLGERKIK